MPVVSPTVAATSLSPSGGPGVAGTAGTSISVNYPTVTAGQLLILCAMNGAPSANSTPSGWTLLNNVNSAAGDTAAATYWRRATGTETGSVTVTHTNTGTADVPIAVILALSNVSSASNPITSSGTTNNTSASTTSPAPPTLSPVPASTDLVLRFYCASVQNPGAYSSIGTIGGTWTTVLRQWTTTVRPLVTTAP